MWGGEAATWGGRAGIGGGISCWLSLGRRWGGELELRAERWVGGRGGWLPALPAWARAN